MLYVQQEVLNGLLVFHVDEKTVTAEICEERCENDVLGLYLAWTGSVPHPRKVFVPVRSMFRSCRLVSMLRGTLGHREHTLRTDHNTYRIDTAWHTCQTGD